MAENIGNDNYYRGRDLMESQRKMLFQKITEAIRKEQGEISYILSCKEKNSEEYYGLQREIEELKAHQADSDQIKILQKKCYTIDSTQGNLLIALQPLFHELFDQIATEADGGIGYNEALKDMVRLNLIFGERELSGDQDGSREHYRYYAAARSNGIRYEKKIQKNIEERKKAKEKVRLPAEHRLISNENYTEMAKILIQGMEEVIPIYVKRFEIDVSDSSFYYNFIKYYILYFFMQALIQEKLVFDMKSTKSKICLDGTVDEILAHFNKKFNKELDIAPTTIKRKLRNNIKTLESPMDLSYQNATLEDIEQWESYLNTTYFAQYGGKSIDILRREIMKEYNSQEGIMEKTFELLNPRYHIYKDNEEKEKKHLLILKEHQKKLKEEDPHISTIIKEIQQKIAYAEQKKQEHTVLEDKIGDMKGNCEYNNFTEIQQKYLKRHKVPIQYRRIFGIVIDKLNNFYKTKSDIIKASDKINNELFNRLVHSKRTLEDFCYYSQNYMTFARIDEILDKKRSIKQSERIMKIRNMCKNPQKYIREQKLKNLKKSVINAGQGSFDF